MSEVDDLEARLRALEYLSSALLAKMAAAYRWDLDQMSEQVSHDVQAVEAALNGAVPIRPFVLTPEVLPALLDLIHQAKQHAP